MTQLYGVMELGIGTTFDYQLPIAQQLREVAETGFDSISLGANEPHSGYLSRNGRESLRQLTSEHRLMISSMHAPFSTAYDLSYSDAEKRMAAVCRVALAMAAAAELSCPTLILHLNNSEELGDRRDADSLLRSLDVLIESAENMKIKLAAENLYDRRSLDFLHLSLTTFKSEFFGFCYDSSHDMLAPSEPYRILEQFADRLLATHLSDNDGKEDRHWLPFTGMVDWERICAILRECRYSHPLLLEVENSAQTETITFLEDAFKAARRLHGMIR